MFLKRRGDRYTKLGGGPIEPYLKPFPMNPYYKNESVLNNATQELIWNKVMLENMSIKAVSAMMSVDMRRVAAVVRLKEVEKQWMQEGKFLALPYHDALKGVLPQHHYSDGSDGGDRSQPFEPINEIHVHGYTMQQIFLPVAESREFTRADAAKAFHNNLLPADKRIPHPELVQKERDVLNGMDEGEAMIKFHKAAEESERAVAETKRGQRLAAEKKIQRAEGPRAQFRFTDVNVDHSGRDGRAVRGVGWRYGNPLNDRTRGVVKIPTSVG